MDFAAVLFMFISWASVLSLLSFCLIKFHRNPK